MTFGQFVKACNQLLKDHPEYKKLQAIYAVDDEGNNFEAVEWTPVAGVWNKYGGFTNGDFDEDDKPFNAVCIN